LLASAGRCGGSAGLAAKTILAQALRDAIGGNRAGTASTQVKLVYGLEVRGLGERRLQTFRGGLVVNHHRFGRQLSAAARAILPAWLKKIDHGFQEGGSLLFAEALKKWSGDSLDTIKVYCPSRPDRPHHVVASFHGWLFLDSDGLGTEADLLRKMVASRASREPQIGTYCRGAVLIIPFQQDLCDYLTTEFTNHFGAYDPKVFAVPPHN
jgi:hypothetical protein